VIGRVLRRGRSVQRLLWYLYGPGTRCEHVNPRLVAGWRHPAELEPLVRGGGHRDFRHLTGLLEQPLALLGARTPELPVWHCTIRAAPEDPCLGDGAWKAIAEEVMHRTGLSERGHEDDGVRWVAVHHGDNHIHIAAILARQDGRRASLGNDYYRIGETLRRVESEYGLRVVARADRTAPRRPSRAEQEKARRAGRPEAPRTVLRRQVEAAAAAARSEREFFGGLAARGLTVRLRHSPSRPGEVTGYAVSLPGDLSASGGPVWYGGGKLAADLSLPKLRRRWPTGHGRLSGREMRDPAARAVLCREVARAASIARSEPEFFGGLEAAGLLVRLRPDPARPGRPAGYAVTLPGLADRSGLPVWYGGGTLGTRLTLPMLRARWRSGLPGAAPGPELFDGASTAEIYAYAARVAEQAARELSAVQRPDVAWAAADLITAAAEAVGSDELRRAAEEFGRAARAPWGRIPAPSPGGSMLRTAAYLLASCRPGGQRPGAARRALVTALSGLAAAVAGLRAQQNRLLQAAAAREAAAGLAACPVPARESLSPTAAAFPARPAARRPAAAPLSPRRGRMPPRSAPGRARPSR
jgi:hypothetical protein